MRHSTFNDAFGNKYEDVPGAFSKDIATILKNKGITDVYVAGYHGEWSVAQTAIGATRQGFKTFFVVDAVRFLDDSEWDRIKSMVTSHGVKIVKVENVIGNTSSS